MTVFDHIGRFEIAKIDPDRVLVDPGDLAHISHNVKHQLLSLLFRSASPYITANPYVARWFFLLTDWTCPNIEVRLQL